MPKEYVHATILEGTKSAARDARVRETATGILCEHPDEDGRPCGRCSSCRRMARGVHEDYVEVHPSGKLGYLTADLEELRQRLRMHPVGDRLVGVIYEAEMLSELLQNKLLKTLEEPYPETVLFLVTNNRESLLPTVRSRCAVLRLTEDERDGEEEQRAEEFAARWHEARFFHEIRALLKDMKNDEEARGLLAVLEREARDRMMQPDLTPEERLAEAHFIEETERTAEHLARKMDFRKALKEFYLRTQRRSKTV